MSEPRSIESIVNSIINLQEERASVPPELRIEIDKRIAMFEGMLNDMTIKRKLELWQG